MDAEPTYFLFARPSFVAGTAALVDFGNTLFEYNVSLTPQQADYFAIKNDWAAVGIDLRRAIAELEASRKQGVTLSE
jgi:hypothetical protein